MTRRQTQCDFLKSVAAAGAVDSSILILPENVLGGPNEEAALERINRAGTGLRTKHHCTHNRPTPNGRGGDDTADDGQIFCSYGDADWLTLQLPQPCAMVVIKTVLQNLPSR